MKKIIKTHSMSVWQQINGGGHEQLMYHADAKSGLRCIIAVHSTMLCRKEKPQLFGGVRMWHYKSEWDALNDALRLSRAMTRKLAIAGEPYGGMKIVLYNNPDCDRTPELLEAFGRVMNSYRGWLITGVDLGLTMDDARRMKTPYIVCRGRGDHSTGSSGENTAYGMWLSLKTCAEILTGIPRLKGLRISVQGLGAVGGNLVPYLVRDGARVSVTDIDSNRVSEVVSRYAVTAVSPEAYYETPCDILSPCAVGGVINRQTIPKLHCRMVAGAANNVLADEKDDAKRLMERNVLFAPDVIINGGGVIQAIVEVEGGSVDDARRKARRIPERLKQVVMKAIQEKTTSIEILDKIIDQKLKKGR